MPKPSVGLRLRDKLGQEASDELLVALEETKQDMLLTSQERFEARLGAELRTTRAELRQEMAAGDASLRVAMAEGFSGIRAQMSEMRAEILRWSFLFWIGQVVAIASLLAFMLRSVTGR